MKRLALVIGLVALLIALLAWKAGRFDLRPPVTFARVPSANDAQTKIQNARPPAAAEERSPLADELNSPKTDIRADLRLVAGIVDTFRTNFPHEGNPVGTNAEITRALSGGNKLRLSLVPRDHPAINAQGELCDRWGTPFFFHAQSATLMEIRSAGPDRKMWTQDDVAFAP